MPAYRHPDARPGASPASSACRFHIDRGCQPSLGLRYRAGGCSPHAVAAPYRIASWRSAAGCRDGRQSNGPAARQLTRDQNSTPRRNWCLRQTAVPPIPDTRPAVRGHAAKGAGTWLLVSSAPRRYPATAGNPGSVVSCRVTTTDNIAGLCWRAVRPQKPERNCGSAGHQFSARATARIRVETAQGFILTIRPYPFPVLIALVGRDVRPRP